MLNQIVLGFFAGVLATLPMSLVMGVLFLFLPKREQYPLPPKEITADIADKIKMKDKLNEPSLNFLTMLSHFGYGGTMGIIYNFTFGSSQPYPIFGLVFGSLVWLISYLIALPALNILSPAYFHPEKRNKLMIFAHFVFGIALAFLIHHFSAVKGFS